MPEVRKQSFYIYEICDVANSDKTITKIKAKNNVGEYPVYAATINKPFAYINFYNNEKPCLVVINDGAAGCTYLVNDNKYTIGKHASEYARVNIAEYSGEYLTWCIDGLAGYIMYHNEKFSITCHRGILLPTDKCVDIDLRYIKYVLEPIFRKRKKGREGDMGKNEYTSLKPIAIKRMTDTIPIPVSEDGKYDFQKQKELADKYEQIEEIKRSIAQKILTLSEIIVL